MTADVELLPLPEPDYLMPQGRGWPYIPAWSENTVHQLIAHATAAKDAEIERLRAEREVIGAEAVKYAEKSGRLEAKAERLAEALRSILHYIEEGGYGFEHTCERVARGALRDHYQENSRE